MERRVWRAVGIRVGWLAGVWSACFGLWLVFVGTAKASELLIGVAAALFATAAGAVLSETEPERFGARARYYLEAWRLPKYIVVGTAQIFSILFRQLFGGRPAESLLLAVPFDAGGDDADSDARRALAITYMTMTPSSVVIGVDRQHGLLLYHQIGRSEMPELVRRLGAR